MYYNAVHCVVLTAITGNNGHRFMVCPYSLISRVPELEMSLWFVSVSVCYHTSYCINADSSWHFLCFYSFENALLNSSGVI